MPHLDIYFLLVYIPLNTFLYKLRHISLSDEGSKKETQLLLPPYNTFWRIVHKGIHVLYKNYLFASRSFLRVSSRYTMVTTSSTLQQNVKVICVSSYAILIVSKITLILSSWWCIIFFGMVVNSKSLSNVSYIDICTAMIHKNISYEMKYKLLSILNYGNNYCSSASIVSVLYQQFKMHFCSRECAFTALLIHHLDDLQNVLLFCIFMYLG